MLNAFSPAYQQGSRLDDVIRDSLKAFGKELAVDGDPDEALKRLSELDGVRILTIHKCKGLEFEKALVLGVEEEFFWRNADAAMSEFFVAISRAKNELVLTYVDFRARPSGPIKRWSTSRTVQADFVAYAIGD